jgi:hypothetical protein
MIGREVNELTFECYPEGTKERRVDQLPKSPFHESGIQLGSYSHRAVPDETRRVDRFRVGSSRKDCRCCARVYPPPFGVVVDDDSVEDDNTDDDVG